VPSGGEPLKLMVMEACHSDSWMTNDALLHMIISKQHGPPSLTSHLTHSTMLQGGGPDSPNLKRTCEGLQKQLSQRPVKCQLGLNGLAGETISHRPDMPKGRIDQQGKVRTVLAHGSRRACTLPQLHSLPPVDHIDVRLVDLHLNCLGIL
jgi:hypothetical protein